MIGAGAWVMGSIASHMVLDTTKWKKGIDDVKEDQKGLDSWADKHGPKLKKVGMAFTVAGGIITGIFGKMILEASRAEETTSKFYAVFKEEAPGAIAWVDDFATAIGRSKVDVMGWMATLQDTFVPLGFAREEATIFSESLTKLAVDLGSFNDIADADVIRDLQSAMVGNHETMRKYGVIISQNNITQELMNMGIDGGAKSATEAEKAQARYNIIVAGTGDAQGDALRTSESFANQMKALKGSLSDVSVEIGKELIPIAKSLVSGIKDVVNKFIEWKKANPVLASTLIKITAGLGALMLVVGPLLIALPTLVKSFGLLKIGMAKIVTMGPAVAGSLALSTAGIGLLVVAGVKFYEVVNNLINAQKELHDAEMLADQTVHNLSMKYRMLAREAGLTSTEFKDLEKKYKGNYLAMNRAIKAGDEGVEMQKALATHTKDYKDELVKSTNAILDNEENLTTWEKQLKKHNIPTLKSYTGKVDDLKEKKKVLKDALKAGEISLQTYKDETKKTKEELDALMGITKETAKETKTWIDYLKDQGLMTVKEKGERVDVLEAYVKELNQAYKDGKIDLKDWTDAVYSAKKEIEALSTTLTYTAIPAIGSFGITLDDLVTAWKTAQPEMADEHAEEFVKPVIAKNFELSEDWKTITSGMGIIFGDLVFDMLMEGDKFVMDWESLLNRVKSIFAGIIADMAQQWLTDFIGKLVSSSATGAESIVSNLASAVGGPGTDSVAGGIESLAGNVAGLANPVNMISGAITAIASVITALQGPGGPSSTDSWHFEQTWIQQKQLTDYTMIEIGGSSGWLSRIHTKLNAIVLATQGIRKQQREKHLKELEATAENTDSALGYLKDIEHNTGKIVSKLKTGQKGLRTPAGAVDLAVLHGPETTLPDADLKALMDIGGGAGGSRKVEIHLDQEVNMTGMMITDRDFTRDRLIPEIIDALKGAFSKTELMELFGLT